MAATRARFEAVELNMTEMQDSINAVLMELQELRAAKTRKAKEKDHIRNPFSALQDDEDEGWEDDDSGSSESESSGNKGKKWKNPVRMDFTKFSGTEDPRVWLDRARQYFGAQEIPSNKRVQWASYHLDGEANQWWRWFSTRHKRVSWGMFERGLLQRFGTTEMEEADEAIIRLRQTGSFRTYLAEFERLVNCLPHWEDKALLGAFLAGVRDELAREIRFFRPHSLEHAIELARHADEQSRSRRPVSSVRVPPKATIAEKASLAAPLRSSSAASPSQPRRLSWAEMQARREKNLCFNCDEQFTRGHVCKSAQALLVDMCGEEESETLPRYDEDCEETEASISLNAVLGEIGSKAMRMTGDINNGGVQLLIDSGASLNFIHPRRAEELQLPVTYISPIFVRVANGERMPCFIRFEAVGVTIQGISFTTTLYGLAICNIDVVLGLPWLESLGPVLIDYADMSMQFERKGEKCVLKGISPKHEIVAINGVEMDAEIQGGAAAFVLLKSSSTCHVEESVQPDMELILNNFKDVFVEPTSLPPARTCDHRIQLKDEKVVVNVAPYRYAHFQKNEIERQVDEMLRSGLIQPSASPFSSPVLLVKKKDGTWRFCVDYRKLNEVTVKDRFPIPTVEDMLDELFGAKYFTKLDLRAGYHQIRMAPTDVPKTAFRVHNGHYEFLVMPFGLCNAPSTFQSTMNDLFRSYLRRFVLVFFDDILIYSSTWDEHLKHVQMVLGVLRNNQFFLKPSKCAFGQEELEYLGHFISAQGVRVDERKIEAMQTWPTPRNVTELRGFLGLTGYYRRFVCDYGAIARPLTQLLKKGKFGWSKEAGEAFDKLKIAMTSTPVLSLPNFEEEFVIETDASGYGIGAVLMQQHRPLAYLSRGLSDKQRGRSTYEKEMLAILEAVRLWRPYLLGRRLKIVTDQRSLRFLLEQKVSTPEQQRWMAKLMGYDHEIVYRPGAENSVADGLSRRDTAGELLSISVPKSELWDSIRAATQLDVALKQRVAEIQEKDVSSDLRFTVSRGCLLRDGKVVVPEDKELRLAILCEFHDSTVAGHSGVLRTYSRLARVFHWQGMRAAVLDYVRCCDICQRNKSDTRMPSGLLQPLDVPEALWADVSMDFIEGLPKSAGRNVIMVVVDRLSKYAHFVALSHPYSARTVADAFVRSIIKLHGVPQSIVSDRDRAFLSMFWQELFRQMGTKLRMSSAYHPETDGQTEVTNRSLEQYLRCYASSKPLQWEKYLAWAEYWYNTTYHRSIKMSPFEAVYGRTPPVVVPYELGSSMVQEVDVALRARDEILRQLKVNLELARQQQKSQADKHRRDEEYEEGDMVYLRLRPYRQQSVYRRVYQKLASRYFGPYKVLRRIGKVAYELQLPENCRVHPIFHVSLLRRRLGSGDVVPVSLPPLSEQGEPSVEPEWVLAHRSILVRGAPQRQVLIKWKYLLEDDSTWEIADEIKKRFPNFKLEDKLSLPEGESDGPGSAEPAGVRRSSRTTRPTWKLRE